MEGRTILGEEGKNPERMQRPVERAIEWEDELQQGIIQIGIETL